MNDSLPTIPEDAESRVAIVRQCLAEALAVKAEIIRMDSNLTEELGADSLAFLDIVFRLERAFNIQITRGEIERAARGDMSDEEFAPMGVLSEAGLDRLRTLMPEAISRIKPGLRPGEVFSLFTTQTFVNMVERKLSAPA